MILYIEKKVREMPQTQQIIALYKNADVVFIDNYKNIFDKNIAGNTEKSCIIAAVNNAILEAPQGYGFSGKWYFLKNSLNCIYDCSYCYLKGAFKNDIPVYFVNYDDIKKQILETIKDTPSPTWFYSSDYSDNLATDALTWFTQTFIPFFETLPNAMMEIRTKSTNIQWLLEIQSAKHTEIAFSLNPEEIVKKYEIWTPSLDMRLKAIRMLVEKNWKVGIRFLPLLDIPNYQKIYTEFLNYVEANLDFSKIHSVFIWGLMYTQEDYVKILKKQPHLDILYSLEKGNDGFVREKREVRDWFYTLFWNKISKCNVCLDSK